MYIFELSKFLEKYIKSHLFGGVINLNNIFRMLESGAARASNVQGNSGHAGGNQVFIIHRHTRGLVCYNAGRLED